MDLRNKINSFKIWQSLSKTYYINGGTQP